MTEEVYSGGTKKFVRKRNEKVERDPDLEKEIDSAYQLADERKKRQKRNKIILISAILAILLIGILTIVLLT